MIRDTMVVMDNVDALAASNAYTTQFYFPKAARIKRYFAVAEAAEAAHATQVLLVTFTDKGAAGTDTTLKASLTNDSDIADTILIESGAWSVHLAKVLDTEARPATPTNAQNTADEIAAGSVIEVEVAKAAGTQTGAVTVGIEFIWSD